MKTKNNTANCKKFEENFRILIEQSGLDYADVANALHLTKGIVRNYCDGITIPTIDRLILIADFFAVPADYLLGRFTIDEERSIIENYSSRFMEMRRAPYEAYLIDKKSNVANKKYTVESPWPYNLLDAIFISPWQDILTKDQEDGLMYAIDTLDERMGNILLLHYKENANFTEIGNIFGISYTRVHQIQNKCIRCLRHFSRSNYIKFGLEGMKRKNKLSEFEDELNKEYAKLIQYQNKINKMKDGFQDNIKIESIICDPKNITIDNMDFSVRIQKCLHRKDLGNGAYCKTLLDLITLVRSGNLMHIRNIGKKSAEEIVTRIYEITGAKYTFDGIDVTASEKEKWWIE